MKMSIKIVLLAAIIPVSCLLNAQPYEISVKGMPEPDTAQSDILYRNCGNLRNILILDQRTGKTARGIRISATGGSCKKDGDFYVLVPGESDNFSLRFDIKKINVGIMEFDIMNPPEPSMSICLSGKTVSLDHGYRIKSSDLLTVQFVVDSIFQTRFKKDARFKASEITVVRNGNIRKSIPVNGDFNLSGFGLENNETIKMELNKYKRINYYGTEFEFSAPIDLFLILKIQNSP